ncbi:anaphase-promoting complex component apc8 [Borealophlyctis nickersoniae]|nr:anaphase-promoting complex component apc8 [Borealophlyctis nickersoniae]
MELRRAVQRLNDRGLHIAAKWAAERLCDLAQPPSNAMGVQPSDIPIGSHPTNNEGKDMEDTLNDNYLLARSYFQNREYARAAKVLEKSSGHKAKFLRLYATYLLGEKTKEEALSAQRGLLESPRFVNKELVNIYRKLGEDYPNNLDHFGLYLYGAVCAALKQKDRARTVLVEAVKCYEWNWSAWMELSSLMDSRQLLEATRDSIADSVMRKFFVIHCASELSLKAHMSPEAEWNQLQAYFPESLLLERLEGVWHHNTRGTDAEFEKAEQYFKRVHKKDPLSLDNMDLYSNALYLKENRADLYQLAQQAFKIDRYRYETCFIAGNYYALRGQHDLAISFFERAIKLNRNYVEAWILIGHEYMELRQGQAAIEAYRRATDIRPNDYRTWYGLATGYRLLNIPHFARMYFERAASLQPLDQRIWLALGEIYLTSKYLQEAAQACKRALKLGGDLWAAQRLAEALSAAGVPNFSPTEILQANIAYVEMAESQHKFEEQPLPREIEDALVCIITHYRHEQNYGKALAYASKCENTERGRSLKAEIEAEAQAQAREEAGHGLDEASSGTDYTTRDRGLDGTDRPLSHSGYPPAPLAPHRDPQYHGFPR